MLQNLNKCFKICILNQIYLKKVDSGGVFAKIKFENGVKINKFYVKIIFNSHNKKQGNKR